MNFTESEFRGAGVVLSAVESGAMVSSAALHGWLPKEYIETFTNEQWQEGFQESVDRSGG